MAQLKRTPLTEIHESLGAKMVDFAGFLMPVAYGSILEEHRAVRERAGIFDVSHMGEFILSGTDPLSFVNEVITNDCAKLEPGDLQYTVMCREDGTAVDDLLVFRLRENDVMLVVNAANIDKDFEHIDAQRPGAVELRDHSDDYALLAVQGPRSRDVLKSCSWFQGAEAQLETTEYYKGFSFVHDDARIIVSRTGYTGELGFEIFVPSDRAAALWRGIVEAGEPFGIAPVGLGARDTLRFEASYALYGHELDDRTSPLEAGLGWVVKLKKESFTGIGALRDQKASGPARKLVGFELEGRNIARQGYDVTRDGAVAGKVTSGAFSPTLQKSLCMALVSRENDDGARYEVVIRNKSVRAKKTRLPFYASRAKGS